MFTDASPVLLIVFNRPKTAEKVLVSLANIKPKKVYVFADGARMDNAKDIEDCQKVRGLFNNLPWQCEIKKLFQEKNLGSGLGPATAISWFFQNEEAGIILEDDCVPSPDFFKFCAELLEKYKNSNRIMQISGSNFNRGRKWGRASYYFSGYPLNWGWATWRRAWAMYDFNAAPEEIKNHIWDFQWSRAVKKNRGLNIVPNINLISNVGFGDNASHTKQKSWEHGQAAGSIKWPLKHPGFICRNYQADYYLAKNFFGYSIKGKILFNFKKIFSRWTKKKI